MFSARSLALTSGTLGLKRLRSKSKRSLRSVEGAGRVSARSLALSFCTFTPSRLSKKGGAHQWHTEKAKLKGV